ncbi:MAG: ATP-dependent Clp protease proteolytic subunit [Candidatus Paceibacterota bacterium]|jgi:ATP-dependent protease ClpP protease subunit
MTKTKDKPKEVILNWIGEIKEDKLGKIIEQIQQALKKNKKATFKMYLQSGGGQSETGLAFYKWVKLNKIDLTVVGLSMIASSATVVFLSGKKRICTSETYFLFHRIQWQLTNKQSGPYDMEESVELMNMQKKQFEALYKKMNFSEQELQKITREGIIFTAEEARERGIVDEIIEI